MAVSPDNMPRLTDVKSDTIVKVAVNANLYSRVIAPLPLTNNRNRDGESATANDA